MNTSTRKNSKPIPLSSPSITSPMMERFGKRISQFKHTLMKAAIQINERNARIVEQKRQSMNANSKTEMAKAKRKEQLIQLENLKSEVINFRLKKRRILKCLIRRHLRKKRDEEESPTQILIKSNFVTSDGKHTDDFHEENDDQYDDETFEDVLIDEGEGFQHHSKQDDDQHQNEEEQMTFEETRLAARAEVVEEIRMAEEVKRHIMEQFSKEREEAKVVKTSDGNEFDVKSHILGVRTSTICIVLECAEDELYESDSDISLDLASEIWDKPSVDICTVENIVADLVNDIDRCATKLSDIKSMESEILAGNAALSETNECRFVKRHAQIDTENYLGTLDSNSKKDEQSLSQSSRFARVSRRARESMATFRHAAVKLDRERREQNRHDNI